MSESLKDLLGKANTIANERKGKICSALREFYAVRDKEYFIPLVRDLKQMLAIGGYGSTIKILVTPEALVNTFDISRIPAKNIKNDNAISVFVDGRDVDERVGIIFSEPLYNFKVELAEVNGELSFNIKGALTYALVTFN